MFFSRIQLNPQRRKTREALANLQLLHAMVASSLPPHMDRNDTGRLLWRIDRDGHDVRLYIISPYEPNLEHIVEQAGWAASPGQTTDYGRFLDRLTRGQEFTFRVTLNPVRQQWVANGRGKLLPVSREDEQIDWLIGRSQAWGFRIPPFESPTGTIDDSFSAPSGHAVRILGAQDRTFAKGRTKNRHTVTQRHVTYTGKLIVEDPERLIHSLTHGMGRGKAYGCGLMTLAKET